MTATQQAQLFPNNAIEFLLKKKYYNKGIPLKPGIGLPEAK
jgi:hypothetical protein